MDFEDMFDEKEIEDALSYDPDVIKGEVELAKQACDYWKSIYPVEHDGRANPPRPPGTGRDSIHVVKRRRYVAVRAEDPIAGILEYGGRFGGQIPEYATRARTEEYFNKGGGGDRVGE